LPLSVSNATNREKSFLVLLMSVGNTLSITGVYSVGCRPLELDGNFQANKLRLSW
jgi:hypothetical protein